ncbi:DNA repair and recombination protein,mitochondrial precursor [Strigomonas culicis]|nr:DNA repair and recombination protein,mitochondrial precursor [Strigomonas culicis]|eukprot:EPY21259.1 DNA repair and recombination protein,mitochondrial precursor [Strigomonas culicis]
MYIGGKAGTGKSHLLRVISTELRNKGLCVLVTASTGVAALNIDGNTFHSTFRVPVLAPVGASREKAEEMDETTESPSHRDHQRHSTVLYDTQVLAQADVIILDEVSLLHAGYLESLDEAARAAAGKEKDKYFGGIQMVLSGDFLQLTAFDGAAQGVGTSDRFVCQRVEPAESEQGLRENGKAPRDDACGANGNESDSEMSASSTVAVPVERLASPSYYNLPMYSSYCFHRALLHVQLTKSARHQTDPVFLRELNELRVGRLPYRLSRSAFLNPYDPTAIRLFAVKHAVKTFNDQKMLALPGRFLAFPTEVALLELTRGNEMGSERISHWSAITLLHFFFAHVRYHFNSHDAHALVKRVLASAKDASLAGLLAARFYVYVCACSPVVHGSAARVAVRFRGDTEKQAQHCHTQFVTLVETYMRTHLAGAVDTKRTTAVTSSGSGARRSKKTRSAAHADATLVKQEPMTMRQLLAAVLPSCQKEKPHSSDLLLQNKYLKVGCRVMLLRNLNHKYVNGSLGTIEQFLPLEKCGPLLPAHMRCSLSWDCAMLYRRAARGRGAARGEAVAPPDEVSVGETLPISKDVKLPVVVMDRGGERVAIPLISLALPASSHDGFFTRRLNCMPLTPAYAFTVHKIQGLTLQHPVLFDAKNLFPCDHLVYVAASRVKEFAQLRMINLNPRMISVHKPSLYFSQRLPTADEAEQTWRAWFANNEDGNNKDASRSWFLPNWASRQ